MRPVKTRPRFKCDFCKIVLTKAAMERHEVICWKNPNRYCELCDNKGGHYEDYGLGMGTWEDCYYCKQKNDPDKYFGVPV